MVDDLAFSGEGSSRIVALFDIDQTVIRGSSSYYVARE